MPGTSLPQDALGPALTAIQPSQSCPPNTVGAHIFSSSNTPSTESPLRLGLNAALPISKEATTSRIVVNNGTLCTVIFTLDVGQVFTEYSSPRTVIVTLLEGGIDFSIGKRTEWMGAGDVICLAPGDRHVLTAVTPCRMQLMMTDVGKAVAVNEKQPGSG